MGTRGDWYSDRKAAAFEDSAGLVKLARITQRNQVNLIPVYRHLELMRIHPPGTSQLYLNLVVGITREPVLYEHAPPCAER